MRGLEELLEEQVRQRQEKRRQEVIEQANRYAIITATAVAPASSPMIDNGGRREIQELQAIARSVDSSFPSSLP
jgi:hypothetical protein